MMRLNDKLIIFATLLALCVIVLGAYVRLSDAGLGCPDWPGCYGHLTVPQTDHALQKASIAFPDTPLESGKAWKEMIHRYLAGILGLTILAIFITAWQRRDNPNTSLLLPACLLTLVTFQAMLGMWTVTLLLKPAVVSAHLLGGMSTLGLLTWMAHRRMGLKPSIYGAYYHDIRPWARIGLIILAAQIFLGGWTSANYAALACSDFPTCQGQWLPPMDFGSAFHMIRELGEGPDGTPLTLPALTAIHWSHRVGAIVTFLYLGWLAIRAIRHIHLAYLGFILMGLLVIQATLGISNIVFSLPLPVAAAHNAVAALLLITLVVLNSKTTRMR